MTMTEVEKLRERLRESPDAMQSIATNLIALLFGEDAYTKTLEGLNQGQDCGQAFFGALPSYWQEVLQWTIYDPSYQNNWESVIVAAGFLAKACKLQYLPPPTGPPAYIDFPPK